jgi:predicted transcriptional regulator
MTDDGAFVDLLARRHAVLAALAEEPRPRHVLVDALPDSKSTVYKGVTQLQAADLVEARDRVLHPTLAGRIALDRYRSLAAAKPLVDLLARAPTDGLDPVAFEGATVVTPDRRAFDRHIVYGEQVLGDADRVEGLVCAVSDDTLDVFRERVVEPGVSASLVLDPALVAALRSSSPGLLDALAAVEHVTLFESARPVPVGLLVVATDGTERLAVELYDDGVPLGIVLNERPEAVAWAREVLASRYESATPLDGTTERA